MSFCPWAKMVLAPSVSMTDGQNNKRIFVLFCVGLFFADFFYDRHPHFSADKVFGFYAIYGFVMFTFIIFASKVLRFFVIRSENFYGEKAVDSEDYPKEQINMEEDNVS